MINDFDVENVYFNEGELNDNEREIIRLLEKNNIDYFISYEGTYYEIGDYKFHSLGTDLNDENDSSMILYGFIYKYSFLLTGDASIKSEEVLLSNYNIYNIDILKVGHHGSKTSSGKEFIDSITPKYSLISTGYENKFGHPHEEVLDNLSNSTIYRTDLVGGIKVEFKNDQFNIKIND